MGEVTAIEWTDHTFNPWIGCAKVSPGCAHCYAETLMDTRYGRARWGKGQPRVRTSPENWRKVSKWARDAELARTTRKVFCASLADWLDDEVSECWLADLLDEIATTQDALVWQLLTKRPENWRKRLEAVADLIQGNDEGTPGTDLARHWLAGKAPSNVWFGVSAEDQSRLEERAPSLFQVPALVRFLSCEPLLGPLDIRGLTGCKRPLEPRGCACWPSGLSWVIVGGESGGLESRPMHPAWVRSIRDQCAAAGVPFFFKQWGEWTPRERDDGAPFNSLDTARHALVDRNGLPNACRESAGEGYACMSRVGKKAAGALLGGREYREFPEVVRG